MEVVTERSQCLCTEGEMVGVTLEASFASEMPACYLKSHMHREGGSVTAGFVVAVLRDLCVSRAIYLSPGFILIPSPLSFKCYQSH